jgi:hypothetical protein
MAVWVNLVVFTLRRSLPVFPGTCKKRSAEQLQRKVFLVVDARRPID